MIRNSVIDAINDAISLVDQELPGICFVVCHLWRNNGEQGFIAARFHANRGPMTDEVQEWGYQVILEFSQTSWSKFWLHAQYGQRLEAIREIIGYLPKPRSVTTQRTEWFTSEEITYLQQPYTAKMTLVKPWMYD